MQSNAIRPALRALSRPKIASQAARQAMRQPARRTYAEVPGDVSKGNTSGSVPNNPGGGSSKTPIFVIGGIVFLMVGGRYIIASNKPAASGQAEQKAIRREKGTSEEYRDPRDSSVKTLEQKKQKESS